MTTGAAEGRVEKPGANPERNGWNPKVAGTGAASVTGRTEETSFEAERLMETIISRYPSLHSKPSSWPSKLRNDDTK